MGLKNIEKYSYSYAFFKLWVKFWHDYIFYRKVEYVNRKNVPRNEHLILTANHQNALMDALAIEFAFFNQPVFVARSDIFSNKLVAAILYWLKILPVYRIRDGYETLKKNEFVFKKTIDVIKNKNNFVIMPEGNHAGFRRLRQLKKGFARIAFRAEEANDFLLHMKIVPVGIDYECYTTYRSTLLVNFGEPMDLSPFYGIYKKNPATGLNKIREALAERMKPLMIHIESREFYTLYNELRKMYRPYGIKRLNLNRKRLYDGFLVDKKLIASLEKVEQSDTEKMKEYSGIMDHFLESVGKYGFGVREFKKGNISFFGIILRTLALIITSPLFLYGFVVNGLPYHIPRMVVKPIKDKQFHSSFKYVLTMLLFPVFYLLETGIFYLITKNGLNTLLFFLSLPASAVATWQWYRHVKIAIREIKYFYYKIKHARLFNTLKNEYRKLIEFADGVFE